MSPLFGLPAWGHHLGFQQPPLIVGLGLAYFVVGASTAAALSWRGKDRAVLATALFGWPFLLPLLWDERPAIASGPMRPRIDSALDALGADLARTEAPHVHEELRALRAGLYRADERLGFVDRLLSEPPPSDDPSIESGLLALRGARDRAAGEIEAVIGGLVQLRLQVGLLALEGNTLQVSDVLRELRGRIGAFDEITRLERTA